MKKLNCPLGLTDCCDTDTRYDRSRSITDVEPVYTCYQGTGCCGLAHYCVTWTQDGKQCLARFRLRCSAETQYRVLLNLQNKGS